MVMPSSAYSGVSFSYVPQVSFVGEFYLCKKVLMRLESLKKAASLLVMSSKLRNFTRFYV